MRTSATALILMMLSACNGCNERPDGADGPVINPDESDGGVVVVLDPTEDPEEREVPIQATLKPTGPWQVAPQHLLIQFNQNIFESDRVGDEPTELEFSIAPDIEGSLRIKDRDLVEFTPDDGFTPGGQWDARLVSVTPRNKGITKPDSPWAVHITAPEFEVVRARLVDRNPASNAATVELVFSSDVSADQIGDRLSIEVDGNAVPVKGISQAEDYSARAAFTLPRNLKGDQEIVVTVASGVPWLHSQKIESHAFIETIALPKGPSVEIQDISLREGHDGFYIEVVCDDDSAGGDERYWWDRDRYRSWWVSSRCLLDESWADQFIRTNPSSEVQVAPGPAGFRIFGDFGRGKLEVTLDAGATTVDGGVVYTAKTESFTVPARSARVNFASKGRYLPTSSWKNLAIQHLNVDQLSMTVRHVPEENLVFWMTGEEPMGVRTSNLVLDTNIAMNNQPDQVVTSWVPVGDLVPDPKPGVYELELKAGNRSDAARLMLTDLHLIAKATRKGPDDKHPPRLRVWALDVHDAHTMSGVKVRAVRASGKVMGECTTSGDVGCDLQIDQDDDPSPPVALIARYNDDLTYIKFDDLRLDAPEDTSGIPYTSLLKHQAPLYTDRGVYRPGDTAHVSGVVRNEDFRGPEAGLPVVIKLFDPKGREIKKRVLQTNEGGMISTDFRFGDYQITGHYRATAEIGDKVAGEVKFQVEEFVPERLKVTAESTKDGVLLGDPAPIQVAGEWLFGGATKNARVEVQCSLEAASFQPEGTEGFSFGPAHLSGKPNPVTLGTLESKTDEEGLTLVQCPAPEGGVGSMGPAQLVAQAAVFEGESGRTTVDTARVPVHPAATYVGLQANTQKAEAGKSFTVKGKVVDWEGNPAGANTKYTLEVYRMEEEVSWWWEDEGSSQQRMLRPAREVRQEVTAGDGEFAFDVTPQIDSAGTLVRVRGEDGTLSELFVEGTGRRYWWSDSRQSVDSTPRPMRPAGLKVELADRIEVGEDVEVRVVAPYSGKILWTVETDTVLKSEWRNAEAGGNAWTFRIDEFTPNVYVSAFVVKDPHLESAAAFLPDRAFGVESVTVIPKEFEQGLTLKVPDEVQPFSPLEVAIDVGKQAGPTFATIAVVDEGILSLTRFQDPDPLGYVFRQRALGVSSYETVGWTLLMQPGGPSSSTGGDAGDAPSRVQMVKPVALWSGVLEADENGVIRHTFEMPGYRGKVRVMVVTANEQRVGAASAQVIVRDPLVLQTTLPRFLLTGDVAQIPVMVANMSGREQEVTIALEAEELQLGATPDATDGSDPVPILEFLGQPTGVLKLAKDEAKTAVFQVRTRDLPGAAHLLITAKAGALLSKEELDIPIQAAASDTRVVKRRALDGGTNDLLADYDGWLAGTDRSTLWVTSNPYAHAMTHLRYLVRYPFG